MKICRIEELNVWQKSQKLAICIYRETSTLKDYPFRDQIRRASLSISSNIAEGFGRKSNREFLHFLFIAKGSNLEVKSLAYLAPELGYFTADFQRSLLAEIEKIDKMIWGLIKHLKRVTPPS